MYHSRVDKNWYNISLKSCSERDDGETYANFTLIGFGHYLLWKLPNWVCRPYIIQRKNSCDGKIYDIPLLREFGICKFKNHFTIRYGLQNDSWCFDKPLKEKKISCFIPWEDYTFIAWRLFNLDGTLYAEQFGSPKLSSKEYQDFDKAKETVPTRSFKFKDFDGEEGIAKCFIEQREWHFGTSWCKWLKYFTRPLIRTNIDITYNIEVGERKGSWKGGTIGCGCDIMPGECLEDTFKRHCEKEKLTYIGEII